MTPDERARTLAEIRSRMSHGNQQEISKAIVATFPHACINIVEGDRAFLLTELDRVTAELATAQQDRDYHGRRGADLARRLGEMEADRDRLAAKVARCGALANEWANVSHDEFPSGNFGDGQLEQMWRCGDSLKEALADPQPEKKGTKK